jgi:predicted PurR-regulated permease PerM
MWKEHPLRLVVVLGIIALTIVICERLFAFSTTLQGVLSTLAGAWFLSFAVRPFITMLHRSIFPAWFIRRVEKRYGGDRARFLARWHLPFGLAVVLVYVLLVVVVVGVATISVAAIIPQTTDLIVRLPEIAASLPNIFVEAWASIAQRFGFDPAAITAVVSPQEISTRGAQLAAAVAQQALFIVTGTAALIGQFVLMLILSLYIVTDGTLIQRQVFALLPQSAHEITRAVISSTDRAFDGYLRGFIVSAVLRGLVAAALFAAFGVNFGVVLALLYAVLSLIPLIGSPVAIIVAALVTLVVRADATVPVTIILVVFDQIVAYVITPRIMSDTVGVPGLVGLLAISVGVQLFGFWGLIFSVPVMGAVYSMLFEYYLPHQRVADGLPEYDPVLMDLIRPGRVKKQPHESTSDEHPLSTSPGSENLPLVR